MVAGAALSAVAGKIVYRLIKKHRQKTSVESNHPDFPLPVVGSDHHDLEIARLFPPYLSIMARSLWWLSLILLAWFLGLWVTDGASRFVLVPLPTAFRVTIWGVCLITLLLLGRVRWTMARYPASSMAALIIQRQLILASMLTSSLCLMDGWIFWSL